MFDPCEIRNFFTSCLMCSAVLRFVNDYGRLLVVRFDSEL